MRDVVTKLRCLSSTGSTTRITPALSTYLLFDTHDFYCAWWRHQMETFSALQTPCEVNHRSPVDSSHKGQWGGALMSSFICAWANGWANNRDADDLRRHRAHYDTAVMWWGKQLYRQIILMNLFKIYRGARTAGGITGHDDVFKLKHFPRYWPFVGGIHRSPVNSPHKGQWRGALMFSLTCVWINGWVNNGEAGDLRRRRGHYGVIVMSSKYAAVLEQLGPLWE